MEMTHIKNNIKLKPETTQLNTLYSITISPPDYREINTGRCNSVNVIRDYEQKYIETTQLFKRLHHCELELYPELSPTGRLHFHGYIIIKNIFNFFYHDLYLLNKISYEIDTLNDDNNIYNQYIKKQIHIMEPIHKTLLFDYPYKHL